MMPGHPVDAMRNIDIDGAINFKFIAPPAMQDDGGLKIVGFATSETIDMDNEIVSMSAISDALHDYAEFSNVREMHNPFLGGAGVANALIVEDGGLWAEATVYDYNVIRKILLGVYKGFSVGYLALKHYTAERGIKVIKKLKLVEISVVDRPNNQDTRFLFGSRFKFVNPKLGGFKMPYVLNNEDKAGMSDAMFAFVGKLNGKSVRIMPVAGPDGKKNKEAIIAGFNMLNSERVDIKAMTPGQKQDVYNTLAAALKETDYDGDIPELVQDGDDISVKFTGTAQDAMDFKSAFSAMDSLNKKFDDLDSRMAQTEKRAQTFFGRIANFFTPDRTKAVEVETRPTDFDSADRMDKLTSELERIPWVLRNVIDNIKYSDLATEEKEAKFIKAFADAKNEFLDTFREIAGYAEANTKSAVPENTGIAEGKEDQEPSEPAEAEPETGKPENQEQEKEPEDSAESETMETDQVPEVKTIDPEELKKTQEQVENLAAQLKAAQAQLDLFAQEEPVPRHKTVTVEQEIIRDREDPNFWI